MLKHFHKILKESLASIFLLLHKKFCNFIQLQLESFYCIYFHKIKSKSALFYKSDCFCLLVCFISLMFILPVSTLQCWLLQLFFSPIRQYFFPKSQALSWAWLYYQLSLSSAGLCCLLSTRNLFLKYLIICGICYHFSLSCLGSS